VRQALGALAVVVSVTVTGTTLSGLTETSVADSTGAAPAARAQETRTAAKPLQGLTIALDPGHQLGNSRYPRQTNRPVPAGGFKKPCNTTGAATNSGVPEATVNFRLSQAVKRRLEALGARVRMTRTTNSLRRWGPCVDARGRFGKRVGAKLTVSLHADGAPSSDHGFHVIAPKKRKPWTTDIAGASLRLATSLRNALTRGGLARSNYIGGGTGLDIRSDLGTLNMSDVPVAMIEIGNMRNAADARRMTSAQGRARYANAVVRGIRTYLRR
jgi:N-acetylmuramoyl-L-alanine amidase